MANPAPAPARKGRGCFFYGCLISACLALVMILCAFFAYRFAMSKLNQFLDDYTDSVPMDLPVTKITDDQMKQLQKRVKAFEDAIQGHVNEGALTLTGEELNALICNADSLTVAKGHVYVSLESNEIRGKISLPMEKVVRVPLLKSKGRYLNGTGVLKASITNGQLNVCIDSLTVRNKPIGESFMTGLRQQNFAHDFNNETNATVIGNINSLEIKGDKLIIKSK